MKLLKLTILFLVAVFPAYSQVDKIDLLISKLDNKKLIGVCNYVWVLKNESKEADTLITIGQKGGKDKTELCVKLYSILTDSTKGIIAHYILSNIVCATNITSGSI